MLASGAFVAAYAQTGDQSEYASVRDDGFGVTTRPDLISILEGVEASEALASSSVLSDFVSHLRSLEDAVQSFRTTPPSRWSTHGPQWSGFFTELQREFPKGRWGNVNNPSGGFVGFWWCFQGGENTEQYLQLENGIRCFKIWVGDAGQRRMLQQEWSERVIRLYATSDTVAIRPRLRVGQYMTVAVLADDYRVLSHDGSVDLDSTVERLRSVEARFLAGVAA